MSKGDPIQLAAADHISQKWLAKWQQLNPDARIHICGSIRRREKMVRDIDLLVLDDEQAGTFSKGAKFEGVELNLCFVPHESEGAGMLFLTGSYQFNIQMRTKAKSMGYTLNRYGLWAGSKLIASKTEQDIFDALGMEFVPPEHRSAPNKDVKGILVPSSHSRFNSYQVFITSVHGFNFCECRGFQYRRRCKHLELANEKVS